MDTSQEFCPVLIKQEPRDHSSDDIGCCSNSSSTAVVSRNATAGAITSTSTSNSFNYHQDVPVDLRAVSAMTRKAQPWSSFETLLLASAGGSVWRRGDRTLSEASPSVTTGRETCASDAMTPEAEVPGLGGARPGRITPRQVCVDGSRESDYSCAGCVRDARGQCSHRLVSSSASNINNNNDNSSTMRVCSGSSELSGGSSRATATASITTTMTTFNGHTDDVVQAGVYDDEQLLREPFAGLAGADGDAASFTCDDCDAHFSNRDTYAMHMLLRAKNEACFPAAGRSRDKTEVASSNAPGKTISTGNHVSISSSALPSASPGSPASSAAAAVLVMGKGHHPLVDTKLEKNGDYPCLSSERALFTDAVAQHKLPDPAFCLGLGLSLDPGRGLDYRGTWWSKYLTGGRGTSGGAVSLGGDLESSVPHLPLMCYLCGELFSSRDSLAMHVLFHTRDVPDPANAATTTATTATTTTTDGVRGQWHKPLSSGALFLLNPATGTPSSQALCGSSFIPGLRLHDHPAIQPPSPTPMPADEVSTPASTASMTSEPQPGNACGREGGGVGKGSGGPEDTARQELTPRAAERMAKDAARLPSSAPGGAVVADNDRPQVRGSSAPAASNCYFAPSADDRERFQRGPDASKRPDTNFDLAKPRPLSADHVVARRVPCASRPSVLDEAALEKTRWEDQIEADKAHGYPFLEGMAVGGGFDAQLEHARTSCSVYRSDRLRKLRTGRCGVYGRAPARGRPPMTIHGAAASRHYRTDPFPSTPFLGEVALSRLAAAQTSFNTQTSSGTKPSAAPSTPAPSPRLASMLKLLASHEHDVSACLHCEVIFAERTLHQLHMGLHNVNNPWQCNACGQVCASRLHFATHALHF